MKRRSVFTRLRTRLDVLEDLILVVKSEISSGEFLTGDFLMEEFRTFRRIRSRSRPSVQLARFTGIISVGCPLPKSWGAYKLFAGIVCCADRMRIGIYIGWWCRCGAVERTFHVHSKVWYSNGTVWRTFNFNSIGSCSGNTI